VVAESQGHDIVTCTCFYLSSAQGFVAEQKSGCRFEALRKEKAEAGHMIVGIKKENWLLKKMKLLV
jgi:hypothetical protein